MYILNIGGLLLLLLTFTVSASAQNTISETFYLGCPYQGKVVDVAACGISKSFSIREAKNSHKTKVDRVIPYYLFYKGRDCLEKAKLKKVSVKQYCLDNDKEFYDAFNDPVNNVIAVAAIANKKRNLLYGNFIKGNGYRKIVSKSKGHSLTSIFTDSVFLPDKSIRGDIARIAKYMAFKHGVQFSKRQSKMFLSWASLDLVDEKERKRNNYIKNKFGVSNPYVEEY